MDGLWRDISKLPYLHKPCPLLKEPSLVSILYWVRRAVFTNPYRVYSNKVATHTTSFRLKTPNHCLTSYSVTLSPVHLSQNIEKGGDGKRWRGWVGVVLLAIIIRVIMINKWENTVCWRLTGQCQLRCQNQNKTMSTKPAWLVRF